MWCCYVRLQTAWHYIALPPITFWIFHVSGDGAGAVRGNEERLGCDYLHLEKNLLLIVPEIINCSQSH